MLNHDPDIASIAHPSDIALRLQQKGRYYAEVPVLALDEQSRLIEQVIDLAFDTLGVRHLEVRVCGAGQEARRAPWSLPP